MSIPTCIGMKFEHIDTDIIPNSFVDEKGVKLDPNNTSHTDEIIEMFHKTPPTYDVVKNRRLCYYKIMRICTLRNISKGNSDSFSRCRHCNKYICQYCVVNDMTLLCISCFKIVSLACYRQQQSYSLLNRRKQLMDIQLLPKELWNIVFQYAFCINVNCTHCHPKHQSFDRW